MQRPIKIGTRGSPLALYQARLVQQKLGEDCGVPKGDIETRFPVCVFTTSGDVLSGKLSEFGGKGLFTKELETALISGDIDVAVHSMKDVPTLSQRGLKIGAILEREDPRDAFISLNYGSIAELPQGACVGTASLRRRSQLSAIRPDIEFVLIRGNVGTRLGKLASGLCDATFLAYAGLKRLERLDAVTDIVPLDTMLCAPAQAAIGIEIRSDDQDVEEIIGRLDHTDTAWCVAAERAFLKALDGSCRTPIAALAEWRQGQIHLRGQVLSTDGRFEVSRAQTRLVRNIDDAKTMGAEMGQEVLTAVGDRVIWDA